MIKGSSCFSLIYLKGEFGISFKAGKGEESTIAQENKDFFYLQGFPQILSNNLSRLICTSFGIVSFEFLAFKIKFFLSILKFSRI